MLKTQKGGTVSIGICKLFTQSISGVGTCISCMQL